MRGLGSLSFGGCLYRQVSIDQWRRQEESHSAIALHFEFEFEFEFENFIQTCSFILGPRFVRPDALELPVFAPRQAA